MFHDQFNQISLNEREDSSSLPRSILDRSTNAKLRVENNYRTILQQAIERNERCVKCALNFYKLK
jgi:hypothetical protein